MNTETVLAKERLKEPVAKEPVAVRKIISVQEIYSDSSFEKGGKGGGSYIHMAASVEEVDQI